MQVFPSRRLAAGGQHLGREVDRAVAGGLRPDEGSAPVETLAGEDAGELVSQLLVHAEEESDFTAAHADVAGGDVGVGPDVPEELGHEALAEAHDFVVALPLRVEVGAALAAAHGEGGEGVLEHLLEGQELEDAQVHRRVEAEPALVGPDGAVHLDPEAPIHLHLALIVHPRHPEEDHPLGLDDPLEDLRACGRWGACRRRSARIRPLPEPPGGTRAAPGPSPSPLPSVCSQSHSCRSPWTEVTLRFGRGPLPCCENQKENRLPPVSGMPGMKTAVWSTRAGAKDDEGEAPGIWPSRNPSSSRTTSRPRFGDTTNLFSSIGKGPRLPLGPGPNPVSFPSLLFAFDPRESKACGSGSGTERDRFRPPSSLIAETSWRTPSPSASPMPRLFGLCPRRASGEAGGGGTSRPRPMSPFVSRVEETVNRRCIPPGARPDRSSPGTSRRY